MYTIYRYTAFNTCLEHKEKKHLLPSVLKLSYVNNASNNLESMVTK